MSSIKCSKSVFVDHRIVRKIISNGKAANNRFFGRQFYLYSLCFLWNSIIFNGYCLFEMEYSSNLLKFGKLFLWKETKTKLLFHWIWRRKEIKWKFFYSNEFFLFSFSFFFLRILSYTVAIFNKHIMDFQFNKLIQIIKTYNILFTCLFQCKQFP